MIRMKIFKNKHLFVLALTMQSSNSPVIVEHLGHVTTIGINRPEQRNCINRETANLLKDAVKMFEEDPTSYVGVLYGTGGNFCAGYDLKELANFENTSNISDVASEILGGTGTVGPTHRYIKKPLIAAVNGYAVAGGFELALMCDLRVLEENAIMGVYCRRFGVPLLDGGTVRLTAMVGLSRALDYILTGRSIEAKEAFQSGLANKLVACGTSLGQAVNLATSLVKFPQACLLADRKSTYNAAFSAAYDNLLKYEREESAHVVFEESINGAKKFVTGIGRHGKFYNITEKKVAAWELDDQNENTKSKL